ncbi:hypothetical protein 2050H1_037 [Serratia phage 2050H1]|uniref:Uncharacterized protein n=1 Tax=Serratia phage 2050H1 TaxID=2024250 RepID=A0A249Y2A5_9CAUD|nr:hypothetical protein 2050H1_037 [Serratia phage 2050H1]
MSEELDEVIEVHKIVGVEPDDGGRVALLFEGGGSTTISVSKQIQMGIDGPGVLRYYGSGREEFDKIEG